MKMSVISISDRFTDAVNTPAVCLPVFTSGGNATFQLEVRENSDVPFPHSSSGTPDSIHGPPHTPCPMKNTCLTRQAPFCLWDFILAISSPGMLTLTSLKLLSKGGFLRGSRPHPPREDSTLNLPVTPLPLVLLHLLTLLTTP